ncbi:MAG: molecular chaperone [Gammaproteobacteria bacterium]|nr:molecular chaperone [Gammaproteobacteria bacterium]
MFRNIIILLSVIFSFSVHAYRVEPMVAEMEPLGKRSQLTMRIDNTSNQPLTVELIPKSMTMDEMGNETTQPADDELLIIPVTATIEPGRSQVVMLRYFGDPSISESKAYRVTVQQVHVERASGADATNVGLLLEFNTLINVKPKNAKPNLKVTNIKPNGKNWLVEIANTGASYARVNETNWRISDSSNNSIYKGSEIGKLVEGSLVLPKSKRNFVMKPLKGFDVNSLSIDIEPLE